MARKVDTEGTRGGATSLLLPGLRGPAADKRAQEILEAARLASMILAIDRCQPDGAEITPEDSRPERVRHIRVVDLDTENGRRLTRKVRVGKAVEKVAEKLAS